MKKKIIVSLLLGFIFVLTGCTSKMTKQNSASVSTSIPAITVQPTEPPTSLQGDIVAASDGENITFSITRNENIQINETVTEKANTAIADTKTFYIGNVKTKKFHRPNCYSLPAEKNRTTLLNRDEAISAGYSPCGNCQP